MGEIGSMDESSLETSHLKELEAEFQDFLTPTLKAWHIPDITSSSIQVLRVMMKCLFDLREAAKEYGRSNKQLRVHIEQVVHKYKSDELVGTELSARLEGASPASETWKVGTVVDWLPSCNTSSVLISFSGSNRSGFRSSG